MTPIFASLFTGFGLADVGARAAGYELAAGLELDPAIAEVGNANLGNHIRVGDITTADPMTFPRVDVLHASPPCTRASVANSTAADEDGVRESHLDIALANATIRFIETLTPPLFTLENVYGYRLFQSFAGGRKCEGILPALIRLGYNVKYWHLNSADRGVPQTRGRLILVASRDFIPRRPAITHAERGSRNGRETMFGTLPAWNGWYAAIEDLIPSLPEAEFAQWQLDRLPDELATVMIGGGNRSKSFLDFAKENRPDTPGKRMKDEPSQAVSATASQDMRVFILDGKPDNFAGDVTPVPADAPTPTVTASMGRHPFRAFVVADQNSHEGSRAMMRGDDAPAFNVDTRGAGKTRAFPVDGTEMRDGGLIIDSDSPANTVKAAHYKGMGRAWLSQGHVVAMTPRCLARFQSLPDWYELPVKVSLACRGIGNGLPSLWYQRILEAQYAEP